MTSNTLHITSGDSVGSGLARSGIDGEVFVWHDILYDGPRKPGWPDENVLKARSLFLERETGGGLSKARVLTTLEAQYRRLASSADRDIVLWFDACLFDQSMLAHVLACLLHRGMAKAQLLCVDTFPGIVPFNGLGQLNPAQLASLYDRRRPVTDAQFRFAAVVDRAFATRDPALLADLASRIDAPLPWVRAAAARWIEEQPDTKTGLTRLQRLALNAVRGGCETPVAVFAAVARADTTPQFWGDTTLWARINALADRDPPLLRIEGPANRLPQWDSTIDLNSFRITCAADPQA